MRTNTNYDESSIIELVVLPIANLKVTLETILNEQQDIPTDELLRGLRLVHENASTILQHLSPTHAEPAQMTPARRIPAILKGFADEREVLEAHVDSIQEL